MAVLELIKGDGHCLGLPAPFTLQVDQPVRGIANFHSAVWLVV